jgi:carboxyl-terminal processing protease
VYLSQQFSRFVSSVAIAAALIATIPLADSLASAGPATEEAAPAESAPAESAPVIGAPVVGASGVAAPAVAVQAATSKTSGRQSNNMDEPVTKEFNKTVFNKVDSLVRKHFYDASAMPVWDEASKKYSTDILNSSTISELDSNINKALRSLKVSHTQFVTPNDEIFYFLKSLFASRSEKKQTPPNIDYVGAITGGVNAALGEVRYVLDGSPAQVAGVKIGDTILTVDGSPYIGQQSFKGTSGKKITLQLRRSNNSETTVQLTPVAKNDYAAYVEAIGKSIRREKFPEGTIGYVHVWCGSEDAHDAIEEAIDKLQDTDGLIFDLRDGYGGNYYDDLDAFYRPPAAYPDFTTVWRNGKKHTSKMTYPKPVVTLINGGSRSGKELLAYSLKQTGRSTLVGEKTAGAVLAGRLFDINERAALYLAVAGGDVKGTILEGTGVSPDVEVRATPAERGQNDEQYAEAVRILRKKLLVK